MPKILPPPISLSLTVEAVLARGLSFITEANTPDVYERSRNMLNFISTKRIGEHINVGFKIKNLLNVDFLHEFDHSRHSFIYEGYREGTSFEFSLGYSL